MVKQMEREISTMKIVRHPNIVRLHEVLGNLGYDGAAADLWSCGVILFVIMAGYLPFNETGLPTLFKKINTAEFVCPYWFSSAAKTLICKILDPNPETRIKIEGIQKDSWFTRNYVPSKTKDEKVFMKKKRINM